MKKERYIQIKDFLKGLITGTEWERHVFTVGGTSTALSVLPFWMTIMRTAVTIQRAITCHS
ncbi:MAG: hypothetical protein SO188_10020 [Prevotella sp.]|nr:hypothetical protein [Prevotella sp.]